MKRLLRRLKGQLWWAGMGSLSHQKAWYTIALYAITILVGSAWVVIEVLAKYEAVLGWSALVLLAASGGLLIWGYFNAHQHQIFTLPFHLRRPRGKWVKTKNGVRRP